jgi:protein subunit release factor B
MATICDLCGSAARGYIRVTHQDSRGHSVMDQTFCTDCWDTWKNVRLNLDGQNEYGVQGMTCPHCRAL